MVTIMLWLFTQYLLLDNLLYTTVFLTDEVDTLTESFLATAQEVVVNLGGTTVIGIMDTLYRSGLRKLVPSNVALARFAAALVDALETDRVLHFGEEEEEAERIGVAHDVLFVGEPEGDFRHFVLRKCGVVNLVEGERRFGVVHIHAVVH